jgi:hypothetical protein
MKTLLTTCFLTLAFAVAGAALPDTARADERPTAIRRAASPVPTADLRLARRWWNGRYYQMMPTWPGGGYYSPYDNPRLYYRRIAPGVYYYF